MTSPVFFSKTFISDGRPLPLVVRPKTEFTRSPPPGTMKPIGVHRVSIGIYFSRRYPEKFFRVWRPSWILAAAARVGGHFTFRAISPEPFNLQTSNNCQNIQKDMLVKSCNGDNIVTSTVWVSRGQTGLRRLRERPFFGLFRPKTPPNT